jgi:hypothetical protein
VCYSLKGLTIEEDNFADKIGNNSMKSDCCKQFAPRSAVLNHRTNRRNQIWPSLLIATEDVNDVSHSVNEKNWSETKLREWQPQSLTSTAANHVEQFYQSKKRVIDQLVERIPPTLWEVSCVCFLFLLLEVLFDTRQETILWERKFVAKNNNNEMNKCTQYGEIANAFAQRFWHKREPTFSNHR